MEADLILVLCLSLVDNGRTTLAEKRSLQFDQSKENILEIPSETRHSFHEGIESEIKNEKPENIGHQRYGNHGSMELESDEHEGIGSEELLHEPLEEKRNIAANSFSNQHLGVQHGYYNSHNHDNFPEGENGDLIGPIERGIQESSNNEGKEISRGVSYQYVQIEDHSTTGNDPKEHNSFDDQERIVESYGTHGEQEEDEDHGEVGGNNGYGHQGAAYHDIRNYFGNFLSHHHHQEPELHEVTKVVPIHETINIPEPHNVQKLLRIPVPVKVIEPYPIEIPVPYAVEKTVHIPVEKIVKYQIVKPVLVKVEKKVPVPVAKPYPVPFPVYMLKLVIHDGGSSHEE